VVTRLAWPPTRSVCSTAPSHRTWPLPSGLAAAVGPGRCRRALLAGRLPISWATPPPTSFVHSTGRICWGYTAADARVNPTVRVRMPPQPPPLPLPRVNPHCPPPSRPPTPPASPLPSSPRLQHLSRSPHCPPPSHPPAPPASPLPSSPRLQQLSRSPHRQPPPRPPPLPSTPRLQHLSRSPHRPTRIAYANQLARAASAAAAISLCSWFNTLGGGTPGPSRPKRPPPPPRARCAAGSMPWGASGLPKWPPPPPRARSMPWRPTRPSSAAAAWARAAGLRVNPLPNSV